MRYNIIVVILLLLGYLWHITRIKLKKGKKPGEGSYKDLIPYFRKFDLETGNDLIGLLVVGGIWLDQGAILPFTIPDKFYRAWYVAPIVGFISPWLRPAIVKAVQIAFKKGIEKIHFGNGKH